MFKRQKGKKLTVKEIRKKQEQKRIDKIENKEPKPKLTEKEIRANKFGKERQEREERSKKTPFIDLIGDILKTPYRIRGGEIEHGNDSRIYKSKGGLIKGKPKLAKRGWK